MALLAKIVLTDRAHDRRPVGLNGAIRVLDKPIDVVIKNLSTNGCHATTSADLRPGDCVIISSVATLFRKAIVVWARNGAVGFEFRRPLQASEVAFAEPISNVVQFPESHFRDPPKWRIDDPGPASENWPLALRAAIIPGTSIALLVVAIALILLL